MSGLRSSLRRMTGHMNGKPCLRWKFIIQFMQGVKLTFFPGSHLARKYFKVVANSKKIGGHYDTHTKKNTYHTSINFLAKRDEK